MTYRRPYSEETKAAAIKAWRASQIDFQRDKSTKPKSMTDIAKQFGISATVLRMWTDPEYADKRRNQINQARRELAKPKPWDYSKP